MLSNFRGIDQQLAQRELSSDREKKKVLMMMGQKVVKKTKAEIA